MVMPAPCGVFWNSAISLVSTGRGVEYATRFSVTSCLAAHGRSRRAGDPRPRERRAQPKSTHACYVASAPFHPLPARASSRKTFVDWKSVHKQP